MNCKGMKWIVRGVGRDFLDRCKEYGLNSHKSPYLLVRLDDWFKGGLVQPQ
jgi:hypothetical protein